MFATHEVTIDVPFEVAAVRLADRLTGNALDETSKAAYEDSLVTLMRVGPFGDLSGLSKLVRVRIAEPAQHSAVVSVALRWEATGAAGDLFPVLDADLVIAPADFGRTRLALTGSYRPPFGRAGAVLDRAIMRHLATATIRSLVEGMADVISRTEPHQGAERAPPGPRRLAAEPGGA